MVDLTLTLLQRDVFVFIADIADNAGLDISPEQVYLLWLYLLWPHLLWLY